MNQQTQPSDVITDTVLTEAREALPSWVVADTPDGPVITRTNEPPSDDTVAWVASEGEQTAVRLADITARFGIENVLLYLEPEPWDLAVGAPVQPEDDDTVAEDRRDPIRRPTNTGVTAGLNDDGQIVWENGPIAALIEQRATEAVAVLAAEVERVQQRFARVAAAGPAAVAPAEVDETLRSMMFDAPDASITNTMTAAVLGNPEAQQALVAVWKAAYQPGMDRDTLISATLPERPEGPIAAVEVWDAVVHEADMWLANQNGTEPPAEGEPETPNQPARQVVVPQIVPLENPEPGARTAAAGMSKSGARSGSSILTEREHQQRRDAARISAERRRKQREQDRLERAMKPKKRAKGVTSSDFQEAMASFGRNGVRGQDLTQGINGYVSGNDDAVHERLLNSAHEMGYEINTFEDGSGFIKKGGHTVQIGAPQNGGGRWSGDGVRLPAGADTRQRVRAPYEKPKAAKKPPKWRSAWGGSKRR